LGLIIAIFGSGSRVAAKKIVSEGY